MKNWMWILVALCCLAGCAPVPGGSEPQTTGTVPTEGINDPGQPTTSATEPEVFHDENRTIVAIDPTQGSPFNNGVFEGWGTSLCWWANRIGYSDTLAQRRSCFTMPKPAWA